MQTRRWHLQPVRERCQPAIEALDRGGACEALLAIAAYVRYAERTGRFWPAVGRGVNRPRPRPRARKDDRGPRLH
jgi:hypothetical protein